MRHLEQAADDPLMLFRRERVKGEDLSAAIASNAIILYISHSHILIVFQSILDLYSEI